MTEAELQASVIELACSLGLLVAWTHDSRRSPRGEPDLRIVGPRGTIWAELKAEGGKLSAEQVRWKWALLASGQDWRCWRPADWHTGQIEHQLRRVTTP